MSWIELLRYRRRADRSQRPLGRRVPENFEHVEKYPLSALGPVALDAIAPAPVTIGINWYSNFDNPVLKGYRYWIGQGSLGKIRGGHCVCLKTKFYDDPGTWWTFYDQGAEGACVGFGSSRMMSLMNRQRYDARWLWDRAKEIDPWSDTRPGDDNGTDVNSAMKILKARGHVPWNSSYAGRDAYQRTAELPDMAKGISAYRWARTVDEVRAVLQTPLHDSLQAVPILNSWGRDYPHLVWLPYTTLQRMIDEDGEVALVTDR